MTRHGLVVLAAGVVLAALPHTSMGAERTVEVVYDDGRSPEQLPVTRVPEEGDVWFLRASDIARLFRATQFWNASSRKIVLGVGRSRFVLTVDTRVVVVDGEPIMMRTPVRYDGGFVLVPLEFVLEIASQHTPRSFVFDEEAMRLSVRGIGFNVTRVSFATAADRTTATLHLTEPLLYHMDTSTPGLVRLKIYAGRIDVKAFTVRQPHGLVAGVRAEQTERDAYVFIDVGHEAKRLRIDRKDEPPQLLLVLEKGAPAPGGGGVEIVDEGAGERGSFVIDKVCLDPGHGGRDFGKESPAGLLEKDVNLAIARAARERIEQTLGLEVVLTRDEDRLVGLTERTEIANSSGADLFVSIHCNGWFNEQTEGFESYFLSPARSESERALARFENQTGAGTGGNPGGDVEFILWDLVQNAYIAESSAFAESIQRTITDRLGVKSRGVKQANFVVLQGARMPAVLIETAFLTNREEERLLADPEFHRRVADGLVEAIRDMQDRYK